MPVNEPYVVLTRSTGPIGQVTVWLEDGLTSAWRGTTPPGSLNYAEVALVPTKRGTFRMFAKAHDAAGCERDRTVTARTVIVQ